MLKQLQQLWARLTQRQRLVVGGGTLLTVITLLAIVKYFGSPEYKPLMTGLEAADAQSISAQLAAKKIPYQMTTDGKGISVPADQLDAARMEIAAEGSPHSGRMGFELFDKSSWGQTEFDEKVNYQRALEGELERTIQTLSGVKSARVHLVMSTASVFLDRERGAKASVTLRMKHGALTPDQLNAISRLVSGAVDDLAPRDVTIIDADSNENLGNKGGSLEGRELEAELSKRLLATLGPALGAENLRTSVNVEYDMSSTEESQDKYDPAVSAVLTSQKSSEQIGAGAAQGGVAGTASNLPNAAGSSAAATAPLGDGAQLTSSENATFGVNKVVLHTTSPAGRIHRLTAAILVNDAVDRKQVKGKWVTTTHKRTPEQLQQIADLAKGILGADTARGDVVTVQNMTFDDTSSTDMPLTALEKFQNGMRQFSTEIRYAGLVIVFLLVWALMIRPVQKQIVASMKELPAPVPVPVLEAPAATTAALAAQAAKTTLEDDAETVRLKHELSQLVQAEPASMTRTLQSWLREDHA